MKNFNLPPGIDAVLAIVMQLEKNGIIDAVVALSRACDLRHPGDKKSADDLYELVLDHLDADIETE